MLGSSGSSGCLDAAAVLLGYSFLSSFRVTVPILSPFTTFVSKESNGNEFLSLMNICSSSSHHTHCGMDDTTVKDNPCWGGPEPHLHDLEYLLRVLGNDDPSDDLSTTSDVNSITDITASASSYSSFIQRIHHKLVVYQDDNYLVINKPPDLRMDGPYLASVHKLLLYLFPPPSLRGPSQEGGGGDVEGDSTDINTTSNLPLDHRHHTQLLQAIAPLSKHSSLRDDPFRIVHQLDYATSGVLLYAKNRKAAGKACISFQERKTDKQYVAIVTNQDPAATETPLSQDFLKKLPELPSSALEHWSDGSLEQRYRKKRRRDTENRVAKQETFNGFMPVHAVFAKWRGSLVREKKEREQGQDGNGMTKGLLTTQKKENLFKQTKPTEKLPVLPGHDLSHEEVDYLLSLGASWKSVKNDYKSESRCLVTIVEAMAKQYNRSLARFYGKKKKSEGLKEEKGEGGNALPPLFRIKDDDEGTFYMCASIGEPKDGKFRVIVDPSRIQTSPDGISPSDAAKTELPEMRPSLTKCSVAWRGNMNTSSSKKNIPVTKVFLKPWTGRRHQLRVHLALVAGFPILGDVAYSKEETKQRVMTCERMCLHAQMLSIPLLGEETKMFVAADPFLGSNEAPGHDRLFITDNKTQQ